MNGAAVAAALDGDGGRVGMRVVEVAVDAAGRGGDRTYTYLVPEALADLEPGEAVLVEFGRRQALGIVLAEATAPPLTGLKPIVDRVRADGRWWYANCAWDAFGICAALHVDGRIETSCPDCGEALTVEVRDERPDDESLLFHCLVPAARWWDDIVFT